jgi:GNAT superfamily N-acetyltransferase
LRRRYDEPAQVEPSRRGAARGRVASDALSMNGPIRRARAGEAAALSDLAFRTKAHWGYDKAFMAACRAELTVTPEQIAKSLVFVYQGDDGPLGFYRLEIVGAVADVALFFVDPPAIGQGIGKALWRHLVAEARGQGTAKIVVESDPHAEIFLSRDGCPAHWRRVVGQCGGPNAALVGTAVEHRVG